jgi:hypothetical protein
VNVETVFMHEKQAFLGIGKAAGVGLLESLPVAGLEACHKDIEIGPGS